MVAYRGLCVGWGLRNPQVAVGLRPRNTGTLQGWGLKLWETCVFGIDSV